MHRRDNVPFIKVTCIIIGVRDCNCMVTQADSESFTIPTLRYDDFRAMPDARISSIYCAKLSGEVVGVIELTDDSLPGDATMSEVRCIDHTCKEGEAYIVVIAVSERARGKGVGTTLMKWAENWALQRRHTMISLTVVNGNRAKGKLPDHIPRANFNHVCIRVRSTYFRGNSNSLGSRTAAVFILRPFCTLQPPSN